MYNWNLDVQLKLGREILWWLWRNVGYGEITNVWDTFSAFIHLAIMFLSTDFLFLKRTGEVTLNLLNNRLTY